MIVDDATWENMGGGIDLISNPRSKDSDNDELPDIMEYNGVVKYQGSNPCMRDSDGDHKDDIEELVGCRLNPDPICQGGEEYTGMDSDSDGLVDMCEAKLGTDSKLPDTDGDGVWDGNEDINHNCTYEPNLNETNPLETDTDKDGLNDGFELKYGTDPTNPDTDGDCLTDGQEDKNKNGQFDMGSETNALAIDTDNDGLADGFTATTGLGEDVNCNAERDMDANGNWLETDPMNPDSDNDGESDGIEIDGSMANVSRANSREGCQLAGGGSGAPTSMYYIFGLLTLAVKALSRRVKKNGTPA
jgi:hypothetical protein